MFYLTHEHTGALPNMANYSVEDSFLIAKQVLIDGIEVKPDFIEGNKFTFNNGFKTDQYNKYVVTDGVNLVKSAIEIINSNSIYIVESISHLNASKIVLQTPRYDHFKYIEHEDGGKEIKGRYSSLIYSQGELHCQRGAIKLSRQITAYGYDYSSNWRVLYNEQGVFIYSENQYSGIVCFLENPYNTTFLEGEYTGQNIYQGLFFMSDTKAHPCQNIITPSADSLLPLHITPVFGFGFFNKHLVICSGYENFKTFEAIVIQGKKLYKFPQFDWVDDYSFYILSDME